MQDYYTTLGLDPKAELKQIKAAYRNLAFQYHPDRNQLDKTCLEKMKAINEAYAVLSDPQKRLEYDRLRQQFGTSAHQHFRQSYTEEDIFRGSDIYQAFEEMARTFGLRGGDDIFKQFYGQGFRRFEFNRPGFSARGFIFTGGFGGLKPGRKPVLRPVSINRMAQFLLEKVGCIGRPQKGKDLQDRIVITPEMARQGGPYAYFLKSKAKKLIVKIPPGIKNGQRIRLAGMGLDAKGGAPPGDLFLSIRIHRPFLEKLKNYLKR